MSIYLDNNASAPITCAAQDAVVRAFEYPSGNPSSPHCCGILTRAAIERTRERISDWLGGFSENYVFTSGCTEANNTVIHSITCGSAKSIKRIAMSDIEHPSVLHACEIAESLSSVEVKRLPVDECGLLDMPALERALRDDLELVAVQWVNSETGVVQDIDAISRMCRDRGAKLFVDAAQAVGRIPIDVSNVHVDYLTFSGHKLHAMPGIGVLYATNPGSINPLLHGGGQENGARSGTENWVGIASLDAALEERMDSLPAHTRTMRILRDRFEEQLLERCPWISINGNRATTVCNTSNACFRGIDGQALVARLDQRGVVCSQTSACSSSRPEPSHTLRAMGLSENDAYSSVRFSFSTLNTTCEIDEAVKITASEANSLRVRYDSNQATPQNQDKETFV